MEMDGKIFLILPDQTPLRFGIMQNGRDLFVVSPCCLDILNAGGDNRWSCRSCCGNLTNKNVGWGGSSAHSLGHLYNSSVGLPQSQLIVRRWVCQWTGLAPADVKIGLTK